MGHENEPIPRKWHFIWLGSALPEEYQENILKCMQHNPDFEFNLYIDSACLPLTPKTTLGEADPDIPSNAIPAMQAFCDQHGIKLHDIDTIPECAAFVAEPFYNDWVNGQDKLFAFAADVLRLCIVYVFGGVYSDLDCTCKGPIGPLAPNAAGLYVCGNEKHSFVDNWFIAAVPKNSILLEVLKLMHKNYNDRIISPIDTLAAYNNLRKICPHNMGTKVSAFGYCIFLRFVVNYVKEQFGEAGLRASSFSTKGPLKHHMVSSWKKERYDKLPDEDPALNKLDTRLARMRGLSY